MSNNPINAAKKYDVAISFCAQDISLAQILYEKLSEGLEVFFFPRNQEELAGTDGLESMREPFKHESRVNLVLYREKWGNTPWTAVEAAAVKDSCLANAFRNLFFFVIEPSGVLPTWLPDTHVRFNYGDFTLEQAVGAVKLRVQEQGGHYTPMTPLKRAVKLEADDLYRRDKSAMGSSQGIELIVGKVKELHDEIGVQCDAVNGRGHLEIRCESKFELGSAHQSCQLTDNRVGMNVLWHQQYSNLLDNSGLAILEFNGRILLPSEIGRLMLWQEPEQVGKKKYEPELSRSRELGWKPAGSSNEFISSKELAEKCVLQFLDLMERAKSGKMKNPFPY